VRVVGVGFGRTGTASLRAALERLGFGPCYHMFVVAEEPWRARGWVDALDGRPDWPAIFDGFDATVDWPGAAYWREILAAYPDAKAILTVRDPVRWHESATRTIFQGADAWASPAARRVLRVACAVRPGLWNVARVVNETIVERIFDCRTGDRAHATAVFERHIADVRAAVPPDRLLVYEVAQGWEPLCAFLGAPVPDEPFPRANDAADFRRWQIRTAARTLGPPLALAALITALALALHRHRRP
jgi:hypothetical protein